MMFFSPFIFAGCYGLACNVLALRAMGILL